MDFIKDPIIFVLLGLIFICVVVALQPRRRPELWLLILTIFLFALPRAGVLMSNINLPLPLSYILVVLVTIEWLLIRSRETQEHWRYGRYFLIYGTVAGLGLALGLSLGGSYDMALLELFFYLFSIGLFFYTSEAITGRNQFTLLIWTLLILSVAVSGYGIAQRYMGDSILLDYITYNSNNELARSYLGSAQEYRRVLSSYGDPNVLASQLIVFAGIAFALIVGKRVPAHVRLLCVAVLVVNIICAVFTGSRAGLIGLAFVGVIILAWRSRWALLVVPVLVVVAIMVGPAFLDSVLAGRFGGLVTATDARQQFPAMALQLLQIAPFGCGFGRTIVLQLEGVHWSFAVIPTENVWTGFNSFWLTLFCRLGLPGVISFVLLLVMLLRYMTGKIKMIQDAQVKAIIVGGLAGLAGQGLIWLANNTYMLPGGGLNFWFMMGVLVAGARTFARDAQPVMLPLESLQQARQSHVQLMPA